MHVKNLKLLVHSNMHGYNMLVCGVRSYLIASIVICVRYSTDRKNTPLLRKQGRLSGFGQVAARPWS